MICKSTQHTEHQSPEQQTPSRTTSTLSVEILFLPDHVGQSMTCTEGKQGSEVTISRLYFNRSQRSDELSFSVLTAMLMVVNERIILVLLLGRVPLLVCFIGQSRSITLCSSSIRHEARSRHAQAEVPTAGSADRPSCDSSKNP